MFKKNLLKNSGKEFEITYGGETFMVPEGEFDCPEELWNHIVYIAKRWWKDVVKSTKTIDQIITVQDSVITEEKEEKEEIKKEIKKETKSKK